METSSASTGQTRRTRIVCISDTHNCTIKLPKGDVLIHAGDLTNSGSYSELSKAIQWLEKTDFEVKIVVAGNHDVTLDQPFYSRNWERFHSTEAQDTSRCLSLLQSSESIIYLRHEPATVRLRDSKGPQTGFKVFGSPYSPGSGLWAFGYDDTDDADDKRSEPAASKIWNSIPSDIDILVTHTPPRTYCDTCPRTGQPLGCEHLRQTITRVRPRLHVCGHIHHGRGSRRVRWRAGASGYVEASVEQWEDSNPDPKSTKMSLVDLTARGRNRPLDFYDPEPNLRQDQTRRSIHAQTNSLSTGNVYTTPESCIGPTSSPQRGSSILGNDGRLETCIVNCAVVATNWPHVGGKRLNKAIVVDMYLPTWQC
ncbi:putative rhamnogalacturonate lyase C [Echria macrotheca]|uniref:Rhamnogalacturonate lyase C n=1 Tax=Echria macrotheca TaxID=438768 RepID=A0AAJ0BMH5_9PEZI|nr:putative rhamnogalacturonate lyase C [Echria macrotheca]